jgi:subtilase family serine protease
MNYSLSPWTRRSSLWLLAVALLFQPWLGFAGQETGVVVLTKNQPRWARAEADLGLVDGSQPLPRLRLILQSTPAQKASLQQLLQEQQDPSSANFHRWLTPEEYGERFGVPRDGLNAITAWLGNQGFAIVGVARGRNWIRFSGTAAQVEAAFHTQLHHYNLGGQVHFANASPPALPSAFAARVAAVDGMDDLTDTPDNRVATHQPLPGFTSSVGVNELAPADLATIYDFAPLWNDGMTGSGITIAVVGESDFKPADINDFRSTFGIAPITVQTVLAPGFPDPGFNTDETEADLDLEWSGGVAPGANLIFVEDSSAFSAATYAIDQDLAPIISQSFETCEPNLSQAAAEARQAVVQQGNVEGITMVAGSGDSGAAACDGKDEFMATLGLAVNNPTSIPEVTSVGGSEFNEGNQTFWGGNGVNGGSALSYIPEMVWNDNAYFFAEGVARLASGGGGLSIYFAQPAWQSGVSSVSSTARMVPDISFTASAHHDPYILCSEAETSCTGAYPPTTFTNEGGTSAPTPMFAGVLALLNQYLLAAGSIHTPGLANINPKLYALAQSNPSVFHDITVGSNREPCVADSPGCPPAGNYGYDAVPGYDPASGLGSIDILMLAQQWAISTGSPPNLLFAAGDGTTTVTVVHGETATYILALTPINGLTGSFTLSCTGVPSEATCTVPSSVNLAGSTMFATVTVTTTAQSLSLPPVSGGRPGLGPLNQLMIWLVVWIVAASLMFLIGVGALAGRRRKTVMAGAAALALLFLMTGCGSSSSSQSGPPSNPGTPAGTYTLNVTATGTTISRSVTLTLNVN